MGGPHDAIVPGRRALVPHPTRGAWPWSPGDRSAEHAHGRSTVGIRCLGHVGCGRGWSMPGMCRQHLLWCLGVAAEPRGFKPLRDPLVNGGKAEVQKLVQKLWGALLHPSTGAPSLVWDDTLHASSCWHTDMQPQLWEPQIWPSGREAWWQHSQGCRSRGGRSGQAHGGTAERRVP